MITVVCVKEGTKYPADYVNRLAGMVRRHTTVPHRFLCLTEDPKGVECSCIPIWRRLPGWWAKLLMFDPIGPLFAERKLYLDLDTVIVDNIDALLQYEGNFCAVDDWWRKGYNGSVYGVAPKFGAHLYEKFHPHHAAAFYSEQEYITECLPAADLWQRVTPGVVGSYKADHLEQGPRDFRLICFHGIPKPHDFETGWVKESWHA